MATPRTFIITLLLIHLYSLNVLGDSLEDSLVSAYKNNPNLKAVREELKSADELQVQARALWLPNFKARSQKQFVTNNGIDDLGNTITNSSSGRVDSVVASYNIFNGGADLASIKGAHYNIDHMRSNLVSVEQQTLLSSVMVYMRFIGAQEAYKISNERAEDAKLYIDAVKARFEAGQGTKTDIAGSEASYAHALALSAKALSDYRYSAKLYASIIGTEPKNLSVPKSKVMLPKTFEEAKDLALKQNPYFISIINRAQVSENAMSIRTASLLPKVALEYSIQGYENSRSTLKSQHSVLITLDIPVFDGGRSWSEMRQSKRNAKKAKYELASIRNEIIEKTAQVWEELQASKVIYKASQQKLKASKVAFEGVLVEEKAGLRDTTDVIAIRSRYFDAKHEVINARSEYFIKLYAVKAQIGECTAKHLNLKVTLYDFSSNYDQIKWQLIGDFTKD